MEKKRLRRIRALAEKLRAIPALNTAERRLFAEHFLMTPDERWQRNWENVQSVKAMDAAALKSLIHHKKESGRLVDLAQIPMLRDILASRGIERR